MANSVTRRFYVDLNTGVVTDDLNQRTQVDNIKLKKGDTSYIGFCFHRDSVPELLTAGSTLSFGIKTDGDYDGDFLASSSNFTPAITATSTNQTDNDFYYSALTLNTNTLSSTLSGDIPTLAAMGEVEVNIGGSGQLFTSNTIPFTIYNDIIKGNEGIPLSGNPPYPDQGEIIRFKGGINSSVGGSAFDLDSIPTTTIQPPFAINFVNDDNGKLEFWILSASTASENVAAGIVRPDDYLSAGNAKVWFRQSYYPSVDGDSVNVGFSPTNYSVDGSSLNSHLSGVDLALSAVAAGFNAGQITADATASYYTPSESTVAGHLSAISTALGTTSALDADSSPALGGNLDLNGFSLGDGTNPILDFVESGNAGNYFTFSNSLSTGSPSLSVVGLATNVDLNLFTKGTGVVNINSNEVLTVSSTEFANLSGRNGGQILAGGTAASETLTLESTTNSTKGGITLASGNWLNVPELASAPDAPSSGQQRVYAKSTGGLFVKSTAGEFELGSTATQYKTIWIPSNHFSWYSGSTGLSAVTFGGSVPTFNCWDFTDSTNSFVGYGFYIPEDWDTDVVPKIKIVWSQTDSNTGGVAWRVNSFNTIGNSDGMGSSSNTSVDIVDFALGQYLQMTTNAATIADDTLVSGEFFRFNLGRLSSSGSDTKTGTAYLIGAAIQYGSTANYTSW